MKTTYQLAIDYANCYSDVSLVRVAKNGAWALFEEADPPRGGRQFKMSREKLLHVQVVQTPYGKAEVTS